MPTFSGSCASAAAAADGDFDFLAGAVEIAASFDETLLGGATVLEGDALEADASDWQDTLYRTQSPVLKATRFRAIPYHLWANRQPGAMAVWLHEK